MFRGGFARKSWVRLLLVGWAALAVVLVGLPQAAAQGANDILVPSGYQISQFATGFTGATAFDRAPNGDLYVLDSGAGFGFAQGTPAPNVKIWKVANGTPSLVYNGDSQKGLTAPALGIAVKDDDTIFVNDATGLNRVHRDGSVSHLIDLPAQGDHAADHIVIGKDNRLYWGEGSATNSGVVGEDNLNATGWLKNHPDVPRHSVQGHRPQRSELDRAKTYSALIPTPPCRPGPTCSSAPLPRQARSSRVNCRARRRC